MGSFQIDEGAAEDAVIRPSQEPGMSSTHTGNAIAHTHDLKGDAAAEMLFTQFWSSLMQLVNVSPRACHCLHTQLNKSSATDPHVAADPQALMSRKTIASP